MLVAAPLMVWNNVNRVLVLIPPPVEPGDAPINIRMDTVSRPADKAAQWKCAESRGPG